MPTNEWNLQEYLQQTRDLERPIENETLVIERAVSGDKSARKALLKAHLSMAAEAGLRLARPGMSKLEAIQEANLILMRVAERPKPEFVTQLETAIEKHFSSLE